jgi:hypothetical protein
VEVFFFVLVAKPPLATDRQNLILHSRVETFLLNAQYSQSRGQPMVVPEDIDRRNQAFGGQRLRGLGNGKAKPEQMLFTRFWNIPTSMRTGQNESGHRRRCTLLIAPQDKCGEPTAP